MQTNITFDQTPTRTMPVPVRRNHFIVFAIIAYAGFHAATALIVLFTRGFRPAAWLGFETEVSKSLAVAIDLWLVTLFGLQHSVMARGWFKKQIVRLVPKELERSVYVVFSVLAFALLFLFWQPIEGVAWSVERPLLRFGMDALNVFGWGLLVYSTFLIDHFELFGLRQAFAGAARRPFVERPFKVAGAYRLVRHPIYVGWLLGFWAVPHMDMNALLFAAGMTLYILAGIALEERDLLRRFGERYVAYRRRVPMLLPRLLRIDRLSKTQLLR